MALKLNVKNSRFDLSNFTDVFKRTEPFQILTAEGATNLAGFLRTKNLEFWNSKKVVGLFDFDHEGVTQFKNLKNETYSKVEACGDKSTGIYKKGKDHSCFVAMLVPVPQRLNHLADLSFPSFVEIEHLLPAEFLIEGHFVKKGLTTGNTEVLALHDQKKAHLWRETFALQATAFENFRPLFSTLSQMFGAL